MLLWIIGFSTLGSAGAVAGAALFLFFPERIRKGLVPCLISYATGTLLGAAFLGMIPAGMKQAPAITVMATVLAAAFLTSIPLGISTALAVIAHEVPQEVGDFAILLDCGYSRAKALVLNGLSSITTLPGALIAYFWLAETREAVPYILAISAASFIYIATADLIPSLHRQVALAVSLRQLVLLLAGIGTIAFFHFGG
ncbi:MAG: ZIP family metal transporter [Methylococcaceae bacterium]|jgi:zinc and cadmium transporter